MSAKVESQVEGLAAGNHPKLFGGIIIGAFNTTINLIGDVTGYLGKGESVMVTRLMVGDVVDVLKILFTHYR